MNDPTRPPDDELVSAYLDGEATTDERATVEADPALLGRVEVLREISARTRAVAPPADRVREANLAAALAAFDEGYGPSLSPSTESPTGSVTMAAPVAPVGLATPPVGADRPGTVTDLVAARQRRHHRLLTVLGSAAAIVLVLVIAAGVVLRASTRSTSTDSAATGAAPTSTANGASAERSSGAAPASPDAANKSTGGGADRPRPSTTSGPPTTLAPPAAADSSAQGAPASGSTSGTSALSAAYVGDLGPLTPGSSFRAALTDRLGRLDADRNAGRTPATVAVPAGTLAQASTCDAAVRRANQELGPPVLVATANVGGQPALVLAYEVDPSVANVNGTHRAFAVTSGCAVVDTQTL